jgi:S-adenosyl-L-methionine hydrolase (adenosine-forming)
LPLGPLSVTVGRVECSIVHIDVFGNVILDAKMDDLSRTRLDKSKKIRLILDQGGSATLKFVRAYHEVGKGELMILEGSQGYVEIASRETSAAEKLRVKLLDRIQITG